jgi:hypothetical protein
MVNEVLELIPYLDSKELKQVIAAAKSREVLLKERKYLASLLNTSKNIKRV